MVPRSKVILIAALLFSVCIFTYFNSLFYDFVFDDRSLIVENPYIKNPKYISEVFQKDLWDFAYEGAKPNYYRPLQTLSYSLDYGVWRLNPFGYHLTNILLHILNGLLVLGVVYLLFNNFFIAAVSCLLFCVHPINSSVVTYISGRADLLAGTFILLTFLFTLLSFKLPKNQKLYFGLAALCSMFAFLSKESALAMPFGIILFLHFISGKRKDKILLLFWVTLSAFLYLYLRLVVLDIPLIKQIYLNMHPLLRLPNFLYLLIAYISLLAMPVNLYLTRTITPILSWLDLRIGLTLIFFIAGVILGYIKRHNKILNFGLIWFLVFVFQAFFVMTGFSQNKLCLAENWIYIAAIGCYVSISYLLYILWLRHKIVAHCLITVMCLTGISITISSSANFKNRISLASHMLRFDFENRQAHQELADAYLENKEYAKALEHLEKSMKLDPLDPDLYLVKGMYYEDTGDIKAAINAYEQLLKLEPKSGRAYNNLGAIYFNKAEFDQARIYLEQAIKLNPLLAEPYLNMAKLCQHNNETAEAVFFYQQVIKLNPDLKESFVNLAKIYLNKRDFKSAIGILNKAQDSGHQGESVLILLGIAYQELGFDSKANDYFSRVLRLDSKSDETMLNLGIFYANRGQINQAKEIWQEGLRNAPENKIIKENIDKANELLQQKM